MTPLAAPFPLGRPRRLRRTAWIRELVAESRLAVADLIWPIFVREGEDIAERFWARRLDEPWLEQVHELVAQAPPGHLEDYVARLDALADGRPDAIRLTTVSGQTDAAYEQLVALVP